MTSEVLIMTPSAVAMAADSVVTVNGNKTYKTFTYTSSKQNNLNPGNNNTSISFKRHIP